MSETDSTKQCPRCKSSKTLSEFYKDARSPCGRQSACKECMKKSAKIYLKSPKGKIARAKVVAKYQKTDAGKATSAKAKAKYRGSDKGKLHEKAYRSTPAAKILTAKRNAKYRSNGKAAKYSSDYKKTESSKASYLKYRSLNKAKVKARSEVNHAVNAGKLIKPSSCSSCDKECSPQGHHDDYALPLTVRWLCVPCHNQWHKENGPGLNG